MSKLAAPRGKVILKRTERASMSEGGIALVHRKGDLANQGSAIAVGAGVEGVEVGDEVIFMDGAGLPVRFEGEDLLCVKDEMLCALVRP